jgi:hypothetical protein
MTCQARHWTGQVEVGFPKDRFGELLDELAVADNEHPDVSIIHETEWALIAYKSGVVVLENLEGEEPVHMDSLDRSRTLELMVAVSEGRIQDAQSAPWQPGYPRTR